MINGTNKLKLWTGTKHVAVLTSYYSFLGSPLVVAFEKDNFEVVNT